jgi:hypothetical protein
VAAATRLYYSHPACLGHETGPHPERRERIVAVERELADERERLQRLAAELAGKELELAQREADLHAQQQRMALSLAQALLEKARELNVPPPLDELAVARARRTRA